MGSLSRLQLDVLAAIRDGHAHPSLSGSVIERSVGDLRDADLVHPDVLELTLAGERALEIAGGGR